VVATGLAWLVLGQALNLAQLAGAAILLSGATVVQLASRTPVTPTSGEAIQEATPARR
jgi:drug/metabolite transporter (DMT)-like permease